tara:strand:- start:44 stop:973 length:930 start_codon:yes stop_codon:yes gene_type:complete
MSLIFGLDASNVQRPVKVNASGELEMTAEIDSSGLAKDSTLTDGSQVSKAMGSEDGTKTGSQKQLRVDGNGRLSVDINSGIPTKTDGTTGHSPATGIGLIGFDSGTARALQCDNQGHLQVDVLNQDRTANLQAFTDINDVNSVVRLKASASGVLEVNDTSGGGGGGSSANQYNNGGTEESLSVVKPTAPATGLVTPATTILDLQNYKGVAFNVTTTSASFGDLTLGVEFSNASDFSTTLGAGYADIQIFGAKVDIGGQPITGQYLASILMIPEFNGQQPLARYARATFNHSNNAGSNISVVINSTQIPH